MAIVFMLAINLPAQVRSDGRKAIAITIDDLPCVNCADFKSVRSVNEKIVTALAARKIAAVGFVNEAKLYTAGRPDPAKVAILRGWLEKGFELGNHTFSHLNINKSTIAEYEADLLRGEIITRPLLKEYGSKLRFFRHPQLRTGPTPESKAALDSMLDRNGYFVAPVTIDSDEYLFALCYRGAVEGGDANAAGKIARSYLEYMARVIVHFEELAREFLGHDLRQVLLLHVSELNGDYLEQLLDLLQSRGYAFISLDEALQDPAYKLPEAVHEKGISWIERWRIAQGLEPKSPPQVPQWISDMIKEKRK